MKRSRTLLWTTIIVLAILIIIFLIPHSPELFSLTKEKLLNGEYWRFLTYAWTHLSARHLIENSIGLLLISLIAFEVKTKTSNYLITYLIGSIIAILPLWFIAPFIAAGASAAMYSVFAFVILSTKDFEKRAPYFLLILLAFIFLGTVISLFTDRTVAKGLLIQDLAHASGLLFGVISFFGMNFIRKFRMKRRSFILRNISK